MRKEVKRLKIQQIIGSDAAVATESGDKVFQEINNFLKNGFSVELDFEGVEIMTTAFLNAAIGQLYSGDYTSEVLNSNIKIINVAEDDKILFKKVIDRAKEYFQDQKKFNNSANTAFYGS